MNEISNYAIAFVLLGVVNFVGNIGAISCFGKSGEELTRRIRSHAFSKYLELGKVYFFNNLNQIRKNKGVFPLLIFFHRNQTAFNLFLNPFFIVAFLLTELPHLSCLLFKLTQSSLKTSKLEIAHEYCIPSCVHHHLTVRTLSPQECPLNRAYSS